MRQWIMLFAFAAAPVLPAISAAAQPQPIVLDDKSSVDQILDALHARGQGLKDFAGDVSIVETDNLNGEQTTLRGKAWYQDRGEGNSRIRIVFDSKKVGDKPEKEYKQEYVLDKGWLIDRDFKRKKEVARQVLKPGQKINLLKLGEGPFPLPVGQPREEVLKQFDVKRIESKKEDPQGTVHVELVPKPGTRFARKFKKLDVYVDTKTNFPRQVNTVDPRETGVRATDLGKINVNVGVTDKDFKLDDIGNDWERKTEAMEE
ncbi:MAG: outer membrane lipoprotein carrier protein LolA [Tepidisphaerales bacterium]